MDSEIEKELANGPAEDHAQPAEGSDVDVARTYWNMASVEQSLGNFQKALDLYEKALEIFIKVLG